MKERERFVIALAVTVILSAVLIGSYYGDVRLAPGIPSAPSTGISRADFNQDGKVDFFDYYVLRHDFETNNKQTDLNRDGIVDYDDFVEFTTYWTGKKGCDDLSIPNEIGECTQILCDGFGGKSATGGNSEEIRVLSLGEEYPVVEIVGSGDYVQGFDSFSGLLSVYDSGLRTETEIFIEKLENDGERSANDKIEINMNMGADATRYILILSGGGLATNPKSDLESIVAAQEKVKKEISKVNGEIEVTSEFQRILSAIAVRGVGAGDLSRLKKIEGVEEVVKDGLVEADLMDSVPLINADEVWQMQDSEGYYLKGRGVEIAVIDTGVDYTHPDLGGCFGQGCKVFGGYDVVNGDNDPMDDNGHGTHVASIAGGSAGSGELAGVAPQSRIYAIKVLNDEGSGYTSWILEGIERAIDPNLDGAFDDHVDVISMSLGRRCWGGYSENCGPDDVLSLTLDVASQIGVLPVVSAGNEGGYFRVGSPGTARSALTVGASDKQDFIADFSSRGFVEYNNEVIIKPEVVAPGVNICAAQWDNAWSDRECLNGDHVAISGTSMSAPHVSGLVALLKQKYPDASPEELKSLVIGGAVDLESADSLAQGYGRVDALNSVNDGLYLTSDQFKFKNPGQTTLVLNVNGGNGEKGVRITRASYYDLLRRESGEFQVSVGDYCVQEGDTINLHADLSVSERGLYPTKIEYEVYDDCSFSLGKVRKAVPFYVYDAIEISFTYDKDVDLFGTSQGSRKAIVNFVCYNVDANGLIKNWTWLDTLLWEGQEIGEVVTRNSLIFDSDDWINSYEKCRIALYDMDDVFDDINQEYGIYEYVAFADMTDGAYVRASEGQLDNLFEEMKREIKPYQKFTDYSSGSFFSLGASDSTCASDNEELEYEVYINGHPDVGSNMFYGLDSGVTGIRLGYSDKEMHVALGVTGGSIYSKESNVIRGVLHNPTKVVEEQETAMIFFPPLVGGGDSFYGKSYLEHPFVREATVNFYNDINTPDFVDYVILARPLIVPSVSHSEISAEIDGYDFVPRGKEFRTYYDDLMNNQRLYNIGYGLYDGQFVDEDTLAEIKLKDVYLNGYLPIEFGEIYLIEPAGNKFTGSGLPRLSCSDPENNNPPGTSCANMGEGEYVFGFDYTDELKSELKGENHFCIYGYNGNYYVNDCDYSTYHTFDFNNNGISFDGSVHDTHGEIVGAVPAGDSAIGSALHFDGEDDKVVVADDHALEYMNQITVSAWVKSQGRPAVIPGPYHGIVSKEDYTGSSGYYFGVYEADSSNIGLRIGGQNGAGVSYEFDRPFEWVHIAGVYDGEDIVIYEDGVEVARESAGGVDIGFNDRDLVIGNKWKGNLDDVRVYRRALSENEVRVLANGG